MKTGQLKELLRPLPNDCDVRIVGPNRTYTHVISVEKELGKKVIYILVEG